MARKGALLWERHARRLGAVVLTALSVGLIALSVAVTESQLAATVVASIILVVVVFKEAFRSSRGFQLTLANLVAIYACVFVFFSETNFPTAGPAARSVAFFMPLLAFITGSLRHRASIARVTMSGHMLNERQLLRIASWLAPIFGIGALSFFIPRYAAMSGRADIALLTAMTAISLIVFVVCRDIVVFLLDTGLLFEEFSQRVSRLVVPAFAFLTCYSLLVILFAALYSVIDHLSGGTSFRIAGHVGVISFPESLYFSLTTLSTVGYGDVAPATDSMRLVASVEIVSGILLLLFGFNEIFSFAGSRDTAEHRSR